MIRDGCDMGRATQHSIWEWEGEKRSVGKEGHKKVKKLQSEQMERGVGKGGGRRNLGVGGRVGGVFMECCKEKKGTGGLGEICLVVENICKILQLTQ